jgi:hypothetical protein
MSNRAATGSTPAYADRSEDLALTRDGDDARRAPIPHRFAAADLAYQDQAA